MIFTDLYKSPKSPLSRLRHSHNIELAVHTADYDPDLISKDKAKQKEAVKRHLQSKVRNDWTFFWPPVEHASISSRLEGPEPLQTNEEEPASEELEGFLEVASDDPELDRPDVGGEETDRGSTEGTDLSETESVYSTIIEDPLHWRPRLEWASELSEDEVPHISPSPFKFDTPDSIGHAVNASYIAGKTRRRRELRKEAAWNEGLACFEARRNAWTGAKVARACPKPASPASPSSPRRGLFWRTHTRTLSNAGQTAASPASMTSPLSPVATNAQPGASQAQPGSADSDNSTTNEKLSPKTSPSDHPHPGAVESDQIPIETMLPIAPPLLPPANPMRASITPALYASIYEKVVVHSLQPSCPINLSDMVRACVAGWKRDGEWPPRIMGPEPAAVVAVKRRKSTTTATAIPPSPSGFAAINGSTVSGRKLSFSLLGGHGHGHGHGGEKGRRESLAEEGSGGSGTGKALRRSLQKVLGIGHVQHPNQPVHGGEH